MIIEEIKVKLPHAPSHGEGGGVYFCGRHYNCNAEALSNTIYVYEENAGKSKYRVYATPLCWRCVADLKGESSEEPSFMD